MPPLPPVVISYSAMHRKLLLSLLLLTLSMGSAAAQRIGVWAVAFYNLENLFDTEDDPDNPGDDEFLPTGPYQWTQDKYEQKLSNLATVISRLAREHCPVGPAVIGISEVENERVVADLVARPELRDMGLRYVHYPSPDRRGIDVALLYNPRLFRLTGSCVYPFVMPGQPNFRSRDQLVVTGQMGGEPVSVIVNHWPSRYGGDKSKPSRAAAAAICRHIADSICAASPENKVIIVGDLNDDPTDESCAKVLGATRHAKDVKPGGYFNATWPLFDRGIGSLCYQDAWCLYDQHIISASFLADKSGRTLRFWKTEVFNRDFITTDVGKKKGYPKRAFDGSRWQNGYSDHFPTITYFTKQLP